METAGQIPSKSPRTKTVSLRLIEDKASLLKVIADERDLTVTDIIGEAIDQYLEAVRPNLCQGCGTYNQIDARFCKNCGLPLNKEGLEELNSVRELVRKNPSLLYQLAQELEHK